MSSSYFNGANQSPLSENPFPDTVEALLQKIYCDQNLPPVRPDTRLRLSSVSEDLAVESLRKILKSPVKFSLDGFINRLLNEATGRGSQQRSHGGSPAQTPSASARIGLAVFRERVYDPESSSPMTPTRAANGALEDSPQLLALGELEFKKTFLMLNYIGNQRLEEVITADEIRLLKDLPMVRYESTIWDRLGQRYCGREDRRTSLEWDNGKTHYYQCHVAPDGNYRFKGPFLENTTTHLHRVLGDENVLIVKFAEVTNWRNLSTNGNDSYSAYRGIAKNGIMVGLRCYRFFVFKDGGKEEKKKDPSTKGVKCYFVRTESRASNDMGKDYIFSGKSIREARMHFMHVHTLPTLANYMARFSLILSKTKKLEVDLMGVNFERIDDIRCHDQNGNDVYDQNGKPCIHSDGTGFISEDLAWKCPMNIYKGQCTRDDNIQGKISDLEALEACGQEPPLLIQFRLFYNGCAVKGTFLMNKKLPPRTIQVRRPSMIKVDTDRNLSNFSTSNALEVVSTSNPPKRTKLSRNLIALLNYGNVPNEFFLDILFTTLEESKAIFYNKRTALKAALNYGDMDDQNAAQMILAGIPLDEPYLKHHLSILLKTQKNDLKAGKLPVTESYYLMGTVDPTGLLEKNEVCVILESGQISGDVLVYRNPGLHFGDVHILKATYVKALEDIVGNAKYGIFFPQKGPRSLANEIAGGDFDGDMYFVSRNPELLKHFTASEPWVNSFSTSKNITPRQPSEFSPEELEDELFELFLATRFHPSKTTGMAADSWLAIMDRFLILGDDRAEEKAEMKKKMLQLIDIYYASLDAPKNGAKVDLPSELMADMFPHYMERERSFKSTSVLGLIYDLVKSHNTEELPTREIWKLPCFEDEPVPELLMDKWSRCYACYRADMTKALQLADGNDRKKAANDVISRYRQELYGAVGFEDSKKILVELYAEALAIYNVVYDYAIRIRSVEKCGFAWKVAGPLLSRFYVERQHEKPMLCSASVVKEVLG